MLNFSGYNIGGDGVVVYRYHTSHSSSHNPGGRGRLLSLSFYSCSFNDNVHEYEIVQYSGHVDERGDMSGDDGDER